MLGLESDLATTVWMLPIIYIILMLLRYALVALFRPLFILIKGDINNQECIFVTFAGLRGSASLIMGSAVVTQQFALYAGTPETFPVRGVTCQGQSAVPSARVFTGILAWSCILPAVALLFWLTTCLTSTR